MKWSVQCHLLLKKKVEKKYLKKKKKNQVSDYVPKCVIILSIEKAQTTESLAIS